MPLINCEIIIQLKWSRKRIIAAGTADNQNLTFQINDTKVYAPVVTFSTEEILKLLKKLESGFKRTINWNKYLAKATNKVQNRYSVYLIEPSFQGVNRLFVLAFEDDNGRESLKRYYLPTVEIKDYNIMIDGINFFDQSIKNDIKTFDKIRKIATGQGYDYTIGCSLDYPSFKKYYILISIDLSKQQKLDADPKAIQKVNFTGNQDRAEGSTMFLIIEEVKETVLDFSKGSIKVLWFYFVLR